MNSDRFKSGLRVLRALSLVALALSGAAGCGATTGQGPANLGTQSQELAKKMAGQNQFKFQSIPSMAEGYIAIEAQFNAVIPTKPLQLASFRDSVVLLYAGELARKAGLGTIAKHMGAEAKDNANNMANGRVDVLKLDPTYGAVVTQSNDNVPAATVLMANPPIWRTDLWEPEPPI